jgi:hypothetical protein
MALALLLILAGSIVGFSISDVRQVHCYRASARQLRAWRRSRLVLATGNRRRS